jgi:predicted nucleic acid-binding OB-fold protein
MQTLHGEIRDAVNHINRAMVHRQLSQLSRSELATLMRCLTRARDTLVAFTGDGHPDDNPQTEEDQPS